MGLFAKLLALWGVLAQYLPSLTPAQIAQIYAAIQKAQVDFTGGNYAAVVNDLIAAIQVIVPQATEQLAAHKVDDSTSVA